jgi:hypothetical protein
MHTTSFQLENRLLINLSKYVYNIMRIFYLVFWIMQNKGIARVISSSVERSNPDNKAANSCFLHKNLIANNIDIFQRSE